MSDRRNGAEGRLDPDAERIRQRLRALRSRYPGLALTTELTHIHDDQVVVRAIITLPDGTAVSAYAAEPSDSTGLLDGAIELAEQRATTRALELLGVGEVTAASSVEQSLPPLPPAPRDEEATPPLVDALRKASLRRVPSPEPEETDDEERGDDPEPIPMRPEPQQPARPEPVTERPRGETPPEPAAIITRREPVRPVPRPVPADEPDMADYSWTDFWKWARANGLSTKGQVEQRIDRPIDGLTVLEVRNLLHEAGIPF